MRLTWSPPLCQWHELLYKCKDMVHSQVLLRGALSAVASGWHWQRAIDRHCLQDRLCLQERQRGNVLFFFWLLTSIGFQTSSFGKHSTKTSFCLWAWWIIILDTADSFMYFIPTFFCMFHFLICIWSLKVRPIFEKQIWVIVECRHVHRTRVTTLPLKQRRELARPELRYTRRSSRWQRTMVMTCDGDRQNKMVIYIYMHM